MTTLTTYFSGDTQMSLTLSTRFYGALDITSTALSDKDFEKVENFLKCLKERPWTREYIASIMPKQIGYSHGVTLADLLRSKEYELVQQHLDIAAFWKITMDTKTGLFRTGTPLLTRIKIAYQQENLTVSEGQTVPVCPEMFINQSGRTRSVAIATGAFYTWLLQGGHLEEKSAEVDLFDITRSTLTALYDDWLNTEAELIWVPVDTAVYRTESVLAENASRVMRTQELIDITLCQLGLEPTVMGAVSGHLAKLKKVTPGLVLQKILSDATSITDSDITAKTGTSIGSKLASMLKDRAFSYPVTVEGWSRLAELLTESLNGAVDSAVKSGITNVARDGVVLIANDLAKLVTEKLSPTVAAAATKGKGKGKGTTKNSGTAKNTKSKTLAEHEEVIL